MDASLRYGPGVGETLLMTEDLVHRVGLQSPGSGTLISPLSSPTPSLGKQCPPKEEPGVL